MDILGRGRSITSERLNLQGHFVLFGFCNCKGKVLPCFFYLRLHRVHWNILYERRGEQTTTNTRRRTHDDEHTTTNTRRQTHNDDTYFHTILLIWNHVDKYEWTGRDQFLHPIPITVTTNKTIWGLSECYDM